MWRALGGFNSPNYHQVVLMNWARVRGLYPMGQEGHAGRAFFVTMRPSLGFCIETRGHGLGNTPRLHFPFDATDRQQRREQFARAMIYWNGSIVLGDFPGKVSLWKLVGGDRLHEDVPSFGALLRQACSGGLEIGDDHKELAKSDVWRLWIEMQQDPRQKRAALIRAGVIR